MRILVLRLATAQRYHTLDTCTNRPTPLSGNDGAAELQHELF